LGVDSVQLVYVGVRETFTFFSFEVTHLSFPLFKSYFPVINLSLYCS